MLKRVSDPEMLKHVTAMGDLLMERLSELNSPHIKEVRGLGLMLGVELDQEAKQIIQAGYKHGIILINAGPNVLRLVPPLIISEQDIDHLINALTSILGA
jgi:acetylornithine/succinyldiaminopimelate/putrescine aminotransferase